MANGLPPEVFIVVCRSGAQVAGGTPTDCYYEKIESSTLYPATGGLTKEQYDQITGGILSIVVVIIICLLMKKAIEI